MLVLLVLRALLIHLHRQIKASSLLTHLTGVNSRGGDERSDAGRPYLRKWKASLYLLGPSALRWPCFCALFSVETSRNPPLPFCGHTRAREGGPRKEEGRGMGSEGSEVAFHVIKTCRLALYFIYIFFFLYRNRNLPDCGKCHSSQEV